MIDVGQVPNPGDTMPNHKDWNRLWHAAVPRLQKECSHAYIISLYMARGQNRGTGTPVNPRIGFDSTPHFTFLEPWVSKSSDFSSPLIYLNFQI